MTAVTENNPRRPVRAVVVAALLGAFAVVPLIAVAIGEPYYITVALRILIFAIAGLGLTLVLGFGGLVSFGHALFIGVGAYSVGILSANGLLNGWLHLLATIGVSGLLGLITGLIALRTRGMAFIMITLAFAQMFYFLAISLKQYGGDDGLQIAQRSDFGLISLKSNTVLYYVTFGVLLVIMYLAARLVNARFGRLLRAAKSNARRAGTLGFPVLRYQVVAYMISGSITGLAGLLLANLTNFASPAYMNWVVSGELIVMVMIGGAATIVGPLVGAAVLIILETAFSAYTQHWMAILGPAIVAIAMLTRRGLYGALK
jgi:branched-chain amino acid transport system permease protein